jgi:hypothetical protein
MGAAQRKWAFNPGAPGYEFTLLKVTTISVRPVQARWWRREECERNKNGICSKVQFVLKSPSI